MKKFFKSTIHKLFSKKDLKSYLKNKTLDLGWSMGIFIISFVLGWFAYQMFGESYKDQKLITEIKAYDTLMTGDGYKLVGRKWANLHGFNDQSIISQYEQEYLDYSLGGEEPFPSTKEQLVIHDKNEDRYVRTVDLQKNDYTFSSMDVVDLNEDNKNELILYYENTPISMNHIQTLAEVLSWNGEYKVIYDGINREEEDFIIDTKKYYGASAQYFRNRNTIYVIHYLFAEDMNDFVAFCCPNGYIIRKVVCTFEECDLVEVSHKVFPTNEVKQDKIDLTEELKQHIEQLQKEESTF